MPKEVDAQNHEDSNDTPQDSINNIPDIVKLSETRIKEMRPFVHYTFMDLLPYITPFDFRNKEEDTLAIKETEHDKNDEQNGE